MIIIAQRIYHKSCEPFVLKFASSSILAVHSQPFISQSSSSPVKFIPSRVGFAYEYAISSSGFLIQKNSALLDHVDVFEVGSVTVIR